MRRPHLFIQLTALTTAFLTSSLQALDWPRFLGPGMNGAIRSDQPLLKKWPIEGPRQLWKATVAEGYSSPVISEGKLILFQRRDRNEVVQCLDAQTGKELWSSEYPATYRDSMGHNSGPRATPAIDGNRVFTYGAGGMLSAWNLNTGEKLWNIDTRATYRNDQGFFGIATSPLVDSGVLIVNIGGPINAGIVGFDPSSGRELWKTSPHEASYSSPTAATINGKRFGFVMTREGLTALDPKTGRPYFEFPWRPAINASVNAAAPLVINDQVFLSVSYGTGAVLLQVDTPTPKPVWSGDDILSSHYASAVHHNGYIYGFDGRQEEGCNLRCVEAATGKVAWSKDRFGAGTLILANDSLLILTERGELVEAPASPAGFNPSNRAQILGFQARAHAALANGLYYARDNSKLVCVDLRTPKE